jgi:hypothetical protein
MLGILTFTSIGNFAQSDYNTFWGDVKMVTLTADKTLINVGDTVTFTVEATFDAPIFGGHVQLFYGDGDSSIWSLPAGITEITITSTHQYNAVGTFEAYAIAFHNCFNHPVGLWETSNTVWIQVAFPVEVFPPPPVVPPRPIPEKPEPPITEPVEPEPEPPPPCGDLDAETFREFWRQWGHQVDRLAFEVPLDDGVDVPALPEPWRSVWKHLTHHRIDVVFSRRGSIYVAEIKPRLSIAAIGTAIVARTMFMRRYDVSRFDAVKAAVISQVGSPTLIQAAATHRVVVFLTKGVDGLYEPVALHDVIW